MTCSGPEYIVRRERSRDACNQLSVLYGDAERTSRSATAFLLAQVIAVAVPLGAGIGIGLGIQDEVKGWYKVRSPPHLLNPVMCAFLPVLPSSLYLEKASQAPSFIYVSTCISLQTNHAAPFASH